ncbi:hypothetical protein, partial [Streptomyces rimosus]
MNPYPRHARIPVQRCIGIAKDDTEVDARALRIPTRHLFQHLRPRVSPSDRCIFTIGPYLKFSMPLIAAGIP